MEDFFMSGHPRNTSANVDGSNISRRRIVIASMVGTTIEFYDFYIYGTAAVSVFPLLFFPKSDTVSALLASMATFGVAFVARPLGSILFGHFGDRVGRKTTLVGSLLTMGIATFLIGLLPIFMQIGLLAPAMLTILRFCQGLGLGGEWSGAALLATETAKEGKRAWAAMWPQLGAPFGFVLANGFFLLLTILFNYNSAQAQLQSDFLVWGWRIPFLASLVMVFVGLYVRLRLHETPVFARAVARGEKLKTPLATVFRKNLKELILGTFVMLATYVNFYLMTTWILSYAIGKTEHGFLGIGYRNFLVLQLIAVVMFAGTIPVSGSLADKFGRRRILLIATAGLMGFGLTFGSFLNPIVMGTGPHANMGLMLFFLCIGMTLMGLSFGPMSAILPELFPTNVRYTGSGIAYNVSSILGAALTPLSAVWLARNYGVGSVGIYLSLLSVVTFIAIWLCKETKDASLDALENAEAAISIEMTSP
jgi:metabolite-proton symporter